MRIALRRYELLIMDSADEHCLSGSSRVQQVELVHRRPAAIGGDQDWTSIWVCYQLNFYNGGDFVCSRVNF